MAVEFTYAFEVSVHDGLRHQSMQVGEPTRNVLDERQSICIGMHLEVLGRRAIFVPLDDDTRANLLLESDS